jgi:transposase
MNWIIAAVACSEAILSLRGSKSNGMDAPAFYGISCAKVEVSSNHLNQAGASTMNITTVGVDLAKLVFQVHGVDA